MAEAEHTVTLYKRQREIVEFISQFIQRNGYSPTLREIGNAMGLSSLATVHEHIQRLIKKGVLKKTAGNQTRGIIVVGDNVGPSKQGVTLPILGWLSAGQPIDPYNNRNAKLQVSSNMLTGKKRAFVLRVRDNTLESEGILENDLIILEEDTNINDGDVVVAILENGSATLKKLYKETTRVRLEPLHSTLSPLYAPRIAIQGKCTGIVRKFINTEGVSL
jgi:repressor LexA